MSHGYVFVHLYYIGRDDWYNARCVYTYRREAFALLVSIDRAMRRPLTVKRAAGVGFTLFSWAKRWLRIEILNNPVALVLIWKFLGCTINYIKITYMKKVFLSTLLVISAVIVSAQQLTKGDMFNYVTPQGVEKMYLVTGENLIENPSFDNTTTGWTGGAGGALIGVDWHSTGGVDDGAYLRLTENLGKGSNGSLGTVWPLEKGKTYVFSYFLKNHSDTVAENPAGYGYIKASMSDTPREETYVLQPLPHVDADLAWTQNTYVFTAEYSYLSLCARWLSGTKCFDSFILAEVEESSATIDDLLALLYNTRSSYSSDMTELDSLGLMGLKKEFTTKYEEIESADEASAESIRAEIQKTELLIVEIEESLNKYHELGDLISECDSLVSLNPSEEFSNSIAAAKAVFNNTATTTTEDLVAAHKALVTARNLYRIENISTASFNFTTTATVGDWYLAFDKTNNVVRVNRYTGSKTDVIIPETFTYNGVEYMTVGLGGYDSYTWQYNHNNGNKHLKSVALPATLRFLGSSAFYYCQGLIEISIPSSVESIGSNAFYNCQGLTEIQLSYGLKAIGGSAFSGCSALESMTIPASVTQFTGYDPFSSCSKLKTLRCEATVPPVCSDNFSNGIHVVYVPAGSGSAYEAATYWKDRIIVDGEGVSADVEVETPGTLGEKLLEQVEYLRQVNYLTVSGTLNSDDIYTIQSRLTGLLTIDMSDVEMAALPNDMFRNRYALQQVVLPNSLTSIGQYAFYGCYNLQDMVLPATLKYIYTYAFCNCDNFEHVVIPEGVTTVGSNAFEGCDALQTVKWPSTATTILNSMFYHSGLESIEIPEGVTTIGWNVFYGTNLAKLECPSTLTAINGRAFADCASLSIVKLNEGLTSLGEEAFYNCDALTSIVLPSTLNSCSRPFSECNGLVTIKCLALIPPYLVSGYDILYSLNKENRTLYVPEWTINKYKLTAGWDVFPTIKPIKGYWPENIRLNQNFTLTLPDTLPADYKPHLLVDWNQGANRQSALTVNGNATLSTNTFGMLYDVEWEARFNGSSITHATLVNNAVMRADSIYLWVEIRNDEWSFLSFPFDVKVADIKPAQISTSVIRPSQENTNFVIRKYSGKERADANFSNTWQDMTVDSILHAGEGYIWQSSRYDNAGNWQSSSAFIVSAVNNANKNLIFANSDRTISLNEYQSEFSHNRSWNLIGNPYPSYYDTRAMDFTAPITVWSMYNNCYYAYSPVDDEYILRPGEAFFVQRPVDAESITFAADGRQTDRVVRDRSAQAKAYTRSADMRQVFNLTLSDGEMTDRTRFVINPDAACDYEMATDANKFMSSDTRAAQLYTIEGDVKFAISERPMADGVITLGAYFGSKGSYTIALDTKVEGISVILVDKVAGTETDLMEGSYTFSAEAGVADNRFEVCMRGDEEDGDTTGMDDLSGKVSVKAAAGQIAVTAPCEAEIEVYNAEGQRIATATAASAMFEVPQGVYVVKVQDAVHKVSVTR